MRTNRQDHAFMLFLLLLTVIFITEIKALLLKFIKITEMCRSLLAEAAHYLLCIPDSPPGCCVLSQA